MSLSYACLQLGPEEPVEAARERIIYAITAEMERQGLIPCEKESAERTVAFVRREKGTLVYDDCADRLDIVALDGLGKSLTGYLRSRGVGVMCADRGVMLRLYVDGRLRDAYISSPGGFGQRRSYWWFFCHGHALRWREQLAPGYSVKELADAFAQGEQGGRAVFSEMRLMLGLDDATDFGFSSLEEVALPGMITLYFRSSNRVRQGLGDKSVQAARRALSSIGALFRRPQAAPKMNKMEKKGGD